MRLVLFIAMNSKEASNRAPAGEGGRARRKRGKGVTVHQNITQPANRHNARMLHRARELRVGCSVWTHQPPRGRLALTRLVPRVCHPYP